MGRPEIFKPMGVFGRVSRFLSARESDLTTAPPVPSRGASIRRAKRSDWRSLRSLIREVFPEDLTDAALGIRLAVDFRNFFVTYEAGGIVGFYCMSINEDPSQAWLDYMGVTRVARGKGLGRALLDHFEGTAEQRGFSRIGLAVRKQNRVARALYASGGYREVRRTERDVVMDKELPGAKLPGRGGRLVEARLPLRLLDRTLYWACIT